ncbi:MAG: DUF1320 domain-containing protein [Prevotellaceae bacterium]|jgi:phage gp36-like protein|nr:DUF1320 domain-containing protein [Prevotellaceae bacterium]
MFIQINELKTAIYQYQVKEIAENDHDVVFMNISAAISEVKSYLAGRYNVDAIFSAAGRDRNPLILELTKNIAVWYIIRPANPDIIYQQAKERYEAAIAWLNNVADGKLNPDLPPKDDDNDGIADGSISWGSESKNNNNY